MMSSRWVDGVTKEEWQIWHKISFNHSLLRQKDSSLGPEEYASRAIAKLCEEKARPVNVEAWIRLVINREYIDRNRRIERRGGAPLYGATDEDLEREVFLRFSGVSPSIAHLQRDEVERVMSVLSQAEYELIMLHVQGYNNHEIAAEVGYKTNKVAAMRIAQIKKKIAASIGENPLG